MEKADLELLRDAIAGMEIVERLTASVQSHADSVATQLAQEETGRKLAAYKSVLGEKAGQDVDAEIDSIRLRSGLSVAVKGQPEPVKGAIICQR
jgi:hypothetical protein